jgi:hypothetical protein
MSLWDALRMNMMISYQELVRTFPLLLLPVFLLLFSHIGIPHITEVTSA